MAAGDLIAREAQIEFNGLLLGMDTPFEGIKLQGWGDLNVSLGNAPRNSRHGSWPGRARAPERVVTFDFQVNTDWADFAAQIDALERATAIPTGSTEYPLVVRTPAATRMVRAKCTARVLPEDYLYMAGGPVGVLQWVASDPRRYEVTERSATITSPTSGSGGLTYPLTYPLDYGTAGSPANATCTNFGTAETNPTLVLTGPITTPRIINSTLGRTLEFNLDLLAGQTLTIDTDAGTVMLNGTTDRLYTRTNLSVPVEMFEFGPGDNDITLLAAAFGVNAQMAITWQSAYL
ncbi:phage distal tail protein [Planobispora rosea]|uniref:phage distal tail protein n=1 Tax=Planobispora rosea TaxID=35762 RepID=UPI00083AEFE5|nr:phage tail domain-containing protein [Planobispora rosea]